MSLLKLLLLLVAVNGAPILAARLFGPRLRGPLDAGSRAWDGRPWLGPSKTWRGLVAAVLAGALLAPLLGWSWGLGAGIGFAAMLGDALSSFIKRRLGRPPSSQVLGLDQIPEALLPAAWAAPKIGLSLWELAVTPAIFFILGPPLSRLLYHLRIRRRPY